MCSGICSGGWLLVLHYRRLAGAGCMQHATTGNFRGSAPYSKYRKSKVEAGIRYIPRPCAMPTAVACCCCECEVRHPPQPRGKSRASRTRRGQAVSRQVQQPSSYRGPVGHQATKQQEPAAKTTAPQGSKPHQHQPFFVHSQQSAAQTQQQLGRTKAARRV